MRHKISCTFKVTFHIIGTDEKGKKSKFKWRSLAGTTLIKWSKWKSSVKREIKIVCYLTGCSEKNTLPKMSTLNLIVIQHISWNCHKCQGQKLFRVKESRGTWQLLEACDPELKLAKKYTIQTFVELR